MKVVVLSLESWDGVWRRNQHLAAELVRQNLVDELVFVEPVSRGPTRLRSRQVLDDVIAVTPSTPIPKSLGGLAHVGRLLRRELLRDAHVLWVNDASLGARTLDRAVPAVYDVTDDWREARFPRRIRRRICRAEALLASQTQTIVCSRVLQERWKQRYGVEAEFVPNGVDVDAWQSVQPVPLSQPGPHIGYIGTLHEHRLDVPLVAAVAARPEVGAVHLIGPNCLTSASLEQLAEEPKVVVHGAVSAEEVPRWMAAMDVLVSPHRVDAFTLSLDAIKAYEYAASGKPVVAT